jgi:hypothetical protein
MSKDEAQVKITTPGAPQAQTELKNTGEAAKQMGRDVSGASDHAAAKTEGIGKKAGETEKKIQSIGESAKNMIAGFLGLSAVTGVLDGWIERFEKMIDLREQFLDSSISALELGKSMSFQTGSGTADEWAKKILHLQKEAGFANPRMVSELMTAMDVMLKDKGGVADKEVMQLVRDIAPDLAAMPFSASEVSSLIDFAQTANVAPTQDALRDYFAKIHKGYTESKSTDPSGFITGLQKGGTAYMSQGGSLEGAIANFAASRAVTSSEELAATLVEQASRLSGGGYEEPRKAIEQAYGVRFADTSIDQRYQMLIGYAASLPESQRMEFLTQAGINPELSSGLMKLATPGARKTFRSTSVSVSAANAAFVSDNTRRHRSGVLDDYYAIEAQGAFEKLDATEPEKVFALARKRAEDIVTDMESKAPLKMPREELVATIYGQILAGVGGYDYQSLYDSPTIPFVKDMVHQKVPFLDRYTATKITQEQEDRFERQYQPGNINIQYIQNYNYATQARQTPNYSQDE